MKLIQSHAWMPGYHTPSCPTDPFNLALLSSPPQPTCNRHLWELAFLGLCDSRKSLKVSPDRLVVGSHTFLSVDVASLSVLPLLERLLGENEENPSP